jgi:spore germination protein GerM
MTLTELDDVYEVSVVVEGSSRVFDDIGNPITVPVSRNDILGSRSGLTDGVEAY